MELFSVTCPTCRRQLRVRDAAAIGQILACPKCGSMVEVTPPEGWTWPDETDATAIAESTHGATATEVPAQGDTGAENAPTMDVPAEAHATTDDSASLEEPVRASRRWLIWGAVAAMTVVVFGIIVGTKLRPRDSVSGDGAAAKADVATNVDVPIADADEQPSLDEPAPEPATPDWELPSDPWERFLFDQIALATCVPLDPFQTIVQARAQHLVAQRNRDEIDRIVYARRSEGLAAALLRHVAGNSETFPEGAVGSALLEPETRLSWIASILPELGHTDWHDELRFGRSASADGNRQVAERTLWGVLNPAVAERFTSDGLAVTHFVGVAGLGADAAGLDATDPRAGVFSYKAPRSVSQISDGLSQTIAIMGVNKELGPWAQGGAATARPLVHQPYINGPDGFGGGQFGSDDANNGVLACMADGSVRYFSADTDPRLLEQLVTIAGGPAPEAAAVGVPLAQWLPAKSPTDADDNEAAEANPDAAVVVAPADWLIALEQRLALPVRDVQFKDVAVEDFCSFVARMVDVPVRLTADATTGERISEGDTLSLRLDNATVGDLLEAALATRGLRAMLTPDGIDVFAAEQPSPVVALSYDIAPLASDRSDVAQRITDLVRRFALTRDGETGDGGTATLNPDLRLVVETSTTDHRRVLRLLAALSLLAGVESPLTTSPPEAVLGPDWQSIARRLDEPVSLPAIKRVGWTELAGVWQDKLGLNVTLDAVAVAGSEIPLGWPGNDAVQNRPLRELLDEWLAPLGLAASWPTENVIRVTPATSLATHDVVAWHHLPKDVRDDEAALSLTDALRSSVMPGSWRESGGVGDAVFDAASGYLLVRQTEPAQLEIARYLANYSPAADGEDTGNAAPGESRKDENTKTRKEPRGP